MGSVYQRNGRATYNLEYKDQHGVTRKNVSTGSKDQRCAEQILAKIEADVEFIRAGRPPQHLEVTGPFLSLYRTGRTWAEFVEEYDVRILAGLAARTRAEAKDSLERFRRLVRPDTVSALGAAEVDDFIAARRKEPGKKKGALVSPSTVNKDLRHLKAALNAAKDWNYLSAVPKIRFQKESKKLPRYVLPEHFTAIYLACAVATMPEGQPYPAAAWWRALMVFIYMSGWRIGQVLALRREAVNLQGGSVMAFSQAMENKGKRDVQLPLHSLVVSHLQALPGFSETLFPWPHDRRTLDEEWHRIQQAAKVKDGQGGEVRLHLPCWGQHEHTPCCHVYGFHDLRRAFATENAERMTAEALQQLMQHKSFQTTLGYISTARQLRQAVPNLMVPTLPLLPKDGNG